MYVSEHGFDRSAGECEALEPTKCVCQKGRKEKYRQ